MKKIHKVDDAAGIDALVWQVRLSAAASDSDRVQQRIPDTAKIAARRYGAGLAGGKSRYQVRFVVTALDLPGATRNALGDWAHLREVCELPDWPLVSLSVQEGGGGPEVDDLDDPARRSGALPRAGARRRLRRPARIAEVAQ